MTLPALGLYAAVYFARVATPGSSVAALLGPRAGLWVARLPAVNARIRGRRPRLALDRGDRLVANALAAHRARA